MSTIWGRKRILRATAISTRRIRDAITRLLSRQASNGSFGLWSVGGEDHWLDAYVTDFLTRARERHFEVPAQAFTLALDRLRNFVATAPDPSKNGGRDLAYAFYVLARNGAAPVGDLRYIADVKLADLATPIAKAQVGAALAMLGDKEARRARFRAALNAIAPQPKLELGRADYGSALRDSAALVTLASEGHAAQPTIDSAVLRVDAARALSSRTSTQEDAWLVLAARALAKQTNAIALDVNGETKQGAFYRSLRADDLAKPLTVNNRGAGNVQAVVSVSGAPMTPEPAAEQGFKIERSYHTLSGEPADPAHAKQNQRMVVVLKVTEPKPQFGRVILADYLPAGFEIDNPHLVSSGDTGTLAWITDAGQPVNTEFRDDRFTAAFDRKEDSRRCSRSPMWCARYRPAATCCRRPSSRICTGPTAMAAPPPARWRSRRANEALAPHPCGHRRVLRRSYLSGGGLWVNSLGPAPLGRNLEYSHVVLDHEGKLLRAFATNEGRWRLPATVKDVDPRFLKLLFAYEDKRFYEHHGVDPLAMVRAAWQLATSGHIVSGGSTITMQVARLLEPRQHRDFGAKLRQMTRALELERALSKEQILSLYLTLAPYGGNLEGIRAASLAYFGKEPRQLSLAEAALLVALPQSPETRRPDRYPAVALAARNRVLDRVVAAGVVARDEATRAKAQAVPHKRKNMPMLAPHAAEQMVAAEPDRRVHRLTIDANLQRSLEELARDRARAHGPADFGRHHRGRQ